MRRLILGAVLAGALLALPAAAATTPTWPGSWQTGWGPLTLTPTSGGGFTGAFGYSDSYNEPLGHVLEAHASGAVLTGTWAHDPPSHFAPRDHGSFTLTWRVKDGVSYFDGIATYEVDGTKVEWHGTCKSGPCSEDHVAPTVKALPASGKAGAFVTLRWRASDDSGTTTDVLAVYKGTKKIWTFKTTHFVKAGETYTTSFRAPKTKGTLRFVVTATDKAGNKTVSTASIRIR